MKKIILIVIGTLPFLLIHAQNVGINQSNPTNSLHINPINNGDHPLRIEGLQSYSLGDSSLLIINNSTGIVKYINSNDLVTLISNGNGLGTDDQTLDSLILNNYTLTAYLEDGGNAFVNLSAISDSAISYLINNSDTLFTQSFTDSIISTLYNNADTLLHNSNFINSLRDSINTDNQTLSITNNSLSISGGNSVDLSQFMTPSGAVFAFPTSTPPSGYLACNGQAVSRSTYANLFSLIGSTYGSGNGTTTFNLPNYNGQFLRGWDNGQGTDLDAATRTDRGDGTTGDVVGSKQANQTLAHNHTVNPPATTSNSTGNHLHTIDPPVTNSSTTGNHSHSVDPPSTNTNTNGNHSHSYNRKNSFKSVTDNGLNQVNAADNVGAFEATSTTGAHSHSVNIAAFNSSSTGNHLHTTDIAQFNSSTTGNHLHTTDIAQFNSGNNGGSETRPTNVSVLWCIKF